MTRAIARIVLLLSLGLFVAGMVLTGTIPRYMNAIVEFTTAFSRDAPVVSAVAFTIAFTGLITLGLPGGAVLSVLSGYLFGPALGFGICLASTSSSALLVWLLVQRSGLYIPERFFARQRTAVAHFMQRHAFGAILLVRMIPIAPFHLVSLLLAYSGVRLGVYWWATTLGTIPSALAFSWIGKGLHNVATTADMSLKDLVLTPMFIAPVLALCLLSLLAAVARRHNAWHAPAEDARK